ncbi:MAG TPA: serine dehydratase subunit alpha family protein [Mogibacterium sp.]|nr:serine dehydratase subunit alpha family protein [Mogibacterium sp.]
MDKAVYQKYVSILENELVPAMGCTEPIALAYAGAKGREILGKLPDKVVVKASGSIIKNTKSVIVPNTNQMKGIPVAVAAGIVAGKSELELQVISEVTEEQIPEIQKFVETVKIPVIPLNEGNVFDILIEQYAGEDKSVVRIIDFHTNIVYLSKNDEVLLDQREDNYSIENEEGIFLSMEEIWNFTNEVNIEDVREVIQRQIDFNWAIGMEGMKNKYGANIGKVLTDAYGEDVHNFACAMAAAGSDARMNGCELPVVVNSGSGNQGITIALPILVYAKHLKSEEETLFRALVLANLIAIYEKTGIGRLSAYCGAVSAGAAAAAGIAFLHGEDYEMIKHIVVNTLAVSSGIICDGAKASCAAKIALSVYSGLLGYEMYKRDQQFFAGDGIVAKGIEATLKNVGELASIGMYDTNKEIIRMMTEE